MLNQVNLADVRSFVLIAQLGNFTKAAEALDCVSLTRFAPNKQPREADEGNVANPHYPQLKTH